MKELIRVRVQYASRQQCCKTHKRPLPVPFRRRIERKIEDVLAEDQFGFRRGKGIWNTTSVVSIPERTLDIDGELYVCAS